MKVGTIILGIFTILSLANWFQPEAAIEYGAWHWPAFVGDLMVAIAFVTMFVSDQEITRRVLFILYALYSVLEFGLSIPIVYHKIATDEPWKKACKDL